MFQGFHKETMDFLEAISKNNNRTEFKNKETLYVEGIKEPLEELYHELYEYFSEYDMTLLHNKRKCISSAYNDARFCKDNPIKEYFYLRFKQDKSDKKNAIGFFFDAGLDGYRYGLNIYHMNARGMEKIRNEILDNKHFATSAIQKLNECGLFSLQGEKYKKETYPSENEVLREWLERKEISFIHEEPINKAFFERTLLKNIMFSYDSLRSVYDMIKEGLEN